MSALDTKLEEYQASHTARRDNVLSKTELQSLVATSQGFPARMDVGKPGDEAGKIFPVGPVEYWNKRYVQDTEQFEWYQRWSGVQVALEEDGHVKPTHTVLHVGCGSSRMAEDMYAAGYRKQTNIDFSHVVIEQQLAYYGQKAPPGNLPGVEWQCMDACDMAAFSDERFHVVLDKGTLDTIVCGEDFVRRADAYLRGVERILKPGGHFVAICHGEPRVRLPYLEGQKTQHEYGWRVTKKHVKKESVMQAVARRGEEEEAARVKAAQLEAEAKAEEAALAEQGLTKEQVEAEKKAAEERAAKEREEMLANETPEQLKARLKAERKAKKKKKVKKKRKVHEETKADGTVIEAITDPRGVHYIYFCTKPESDD